MAGASILVVEDEAIVAFNLQRILMGFGYQVPDTVESGLLAIQAVETFRPDLVLMDIHLQGAMDGIQAAHCIRAQYDLPIVYLTAYAEETRLAQACETVPYGYLIKPVQDRELRATIETALLRHRLDMKLKESETAYRELYHKTRRAEAAERDQRTLAEALRDTAAALSSTLSFAEVLERVLNNVGKVVPYDAVNIMLVEDEIARIVRCQGYREPSLEDQAMASSFKIRELPQLFRMAETRMPVTYPNTQQLPGWEPGWARSYAGVPMIIKGRLVGFINLIGLTPGFYTQETGSRLQAFADQAAIAIENARLYTEVQRLATLDDVTGIFNRRRLLELGQREYERTRRYALPFAAILLDIDRFKKVNDTYGHITGDRVLAGMAETISRNIREVDIFGRYGGEEFTVFLPQTDRHAALEVAERLRALVAQQSFDTGRGKITVTISLGVALLTDDTPSLAALIDQTDQAMYAAKQAGRNRVEIYNS